MALDEAQALFWRAITWPSGVEDFLERAGGGVRRRLAEVFRESPEFSRVQRLDVYANAYFYRLLGALGEMFPRLAALAGKPAFHNLITDYVLAWPPSEPDLRRAGDRLPEFVAAHALTRELPLLADVACLEQALDRALDAPDTPRLERLALASVPAEQWPSLVFRLSAPTRLVRLEWDFAELVQQLDAGALDAARRLPRASVPPTFLVGRRGHAPYARRLEALESAALRALGAGARFDELCDLFSRQIPPAQASDVVQYLGRWLGDGVLGSFESR